MLHPNNTFHNGTCGFSSYLQCLFMLLLEFNESVVRARARGTVDNSNVLFQGLAFFMTDNETG